MGPAPEVVQTSSAAASASNNASTSNANNDEEDTYYYDEATGAVYDGQGRLVQMPAGFDASALQQQQQQQHSVDTAAAVPNGSIRQADVLLGAISEVMPAAQMNNTRDWDNTSASLAPSYRGQSFEDQGSSQTKLSPIDRPDSDVSSYNTVSALRRANSNSNFSPLDMLPEMRSNSGSRQVSREGATARDVGYTISGSAQLDQARRGSAQSGIELLPSHNTMRQRNNRGNFNEGGQTPTTEMKFKLDSNSYDDFDTVEGKYQRHLNMDHGDGSDNISPGSQKPVLGKGLRMVELEMETEEDSPYPEVRASVSNMDDPEMMVNTFRVWFLSIVLSTIAGAINTLLNFRTRAPYLSPLVCLLVAYPCGKVMAAVLPIRTWTLPRRLGGYSFSLNPGMFNIKEHAMISVALNISIVQAYGISSTIALTSPAFYGIPRPVIFSVLYIISSQLIGFGLAGISRRFLVYPASMIWPQNLVTTTILNTLHAEEDGHDGKLTRFRYFLYVLLGGTLLYFLPGYLFTALSNFSWLCWIWPNNFVVNTIFGTSTGLGLSVLTLDWSQISYIGSPLVYPWWAECNIFAGFIIIEVIVGLAIYFSNALDMAYFPFNTSGAFDRFGASYDIQQILSDKFTLNVEAYEQYSRLYLPTTYMLVYATTLAAITALFVHTALYHGKTLWRGIRNFRTEEDDIHAKLMKRYKEVPEWWYALIGAVTFVLAIITVEVWDTTVPIWALLLAVLVPALYVLPAGFIFAMTGQAVSTNVISELIAGYALPGNPIANQIIKVYGVQTLISGLTFTQNLKVGHYMKLPPRNVFIIQLVVAIWVPIVQIGIQQFMLGHIEGVCESDQTHNFTCPIARVFYTASIVWGIIGPDRLFGSAAVYRLYWCLLVGALLPFPFWFLSRKYPTSWIRFISIPIALNAVTYIPPASGLVYTSWFFVAFIFQYLIRKYNFRWWSKFNFVTSAGMDSGTILATLIIFLVLQLPKNGTIAVNWWGNSVFENTIDYQATPLRVPPIQGFAPPPSALH